MTGKPVVRFAPSPTGYLHIGGARTALFNWLFARSQGGKFILRIEDTDQERSEKAFEKEILESMEWLGLDWDTELTYQSQRLDMYHEYARKLIALGYAHTEKGPDGAGEAVIFKYPHEEVTFKDIVYGEIKFDLSLLEQLVLIKSDGMPTYNFACVVDDVSMGITHIIRGDDHISNTPKQLALYKALGFARPVFAHVPMIIGEDGKRLSKRHGAVAVSQYRQDGFLADALVNYLALLGWSPGGDRELMARSEMIKLFSLERIGKKSALFSLKKLTWTNSQYLMKMPAKDIQKELGPFYKNRDLDIHALEEQKVQALIDLYKMRAKTLVEFPMMTGAFFLEVPIVYSEEIKNTYFANATIMKTMRSLYDAFIPLTKFDKPALEDVFRKLMEQLGIKSGDLIHPLRSIVAGMSASAGIFEILEIMGKEFVLKRMREAFDVAGMKNA